MIGLFVLLLIVQILSTLFAVKLDRIQRKIDLGNEIVRLSNRKNSSVQSGRLAGSVSVEDQVKAIGYIEGLTDVFNFITGEDDKDK